MWTDWSVQSLASLHGENGIWAMVNTYLNRIAHD
jgi:hypothetical protein